MERQIGNQLPELTVLVPNLLQLLHLRRQQPVMLLLPVEVGCLAEAGPPADLRYRNPIGSPASK